MKRVMVTGAAGFIGLNLVKALKEANAVICVLVEKNNEKGIAALRDIDPEIRIEDDLETLMSEANSIEPFDVIYHLATVGVRPEYNDITAICDVNIRLGCRLVDFAKANSTGLLVNFGSCFEYGDHGNELLTEDMVCMPKTLYAISKNAATNLITCYSESLGVNMITVRPFGVFGRGEALQRLAPSVIRSCINGRTVRTTAGDQVRDFVNVKDVVRAVIRLSEAEYTSYEVYNICSDNPVKVKDFISEIVEVCGFDGKLIEFGAIPYRKNEAMVFAGNNGKLQSLIGYPFPTDHREGILDLFRSIKAERQK